MIIHDSIHDQLRQWTGTQRMWNGVSFNNLWRQFNWKLKFYALKANWELTAEVLFIFLCRQLHILLDNRQFAHWRSQEAERRVGIIWCCCEMTGDWQEIMKYGWNQQLSSSSYHNTLSSHSADGWKIFQKLFPQLFLFSVDVCMIVIVWMKRLTSHPPPSLSSRSSTCSIVSPLYLHPRCSPSLILLPSRHLLASSIDHRTMDRSRAKDFLPSLQKYFLTSLTSCLQYSEIFLLCVLCVVK